MTTETKEAEQKVTTGGSSLMSDLSSFASSGKKLKTAKKRVQKAIVTPRDPLYKIDESKPAKRLLIIDFQTDWYVQFKDCALKDGTPLMIEQTRWPLIDLESFAGGNGNGNVNNNGASKNGSKNKIMVELQANNQIPNPIRMKNGESNKTVLFMPDFLLIRSLPTNIHGYDFMNILMGFMFVNMPCVNSLQSIFMTMQRCLVYAALNKFNNLPLIPMKYHPNFTARTDALLNNNSNNNNNNNNNNNGTAENEEYPKVIKVGNCHSGYDKSKIMDKGNMDDIKSILILSKDYYTEEKLIENIDFEYRIQKIGKIIRVFKRIQSDNWKTHISSFVPYKMTDKHKEWIDDASSIFGGLDICALDVLKTKDGQDIILELNDTAIGLMGAHEVEDESNIRDLVVEKMSDIWCD